MRLSTLLEALHGEPGGVPLATARMEADPVIRGISYDSRKVAPGDLFFALRGAVSDGHDYIETAVHMGAVALMVEEELPEERRAGLAAVVVPDARRAMAPIATRFFGEPADALDLVGITGTNGKTSTSYLIESILNQAGVRTGLIGTVECRFGGERIVSTNTTPESFDLQRLLRSMCTDNIETTVMEVSSHGLALGRVRGCRFKVAALTNVTQDHLDFHGDMATYRSAKELLFSTYLADDGVAVINLDDPASEAFLAIARDRSVRVVGVTRDPDRTAEVVLQSADVGLSGSQVRLRLPSGPLDLEVPLIGDFNLENLIVACGIAVALDIEPERIAAGVASCRQVPGRMEVVVHDNDRAPTVIVDYAHTPDAVEKLLRAVRPLCKGRMIAVFGCGGDRDRAKRPLMAQAVAQLSDRAIATSDNPRTEDPLQILADVERGLAQLERVEADALNDREGSYALIPDRRTAIEVAISIGRPEDTIVLAGKGHEDYQIIGADKLPFDDRVEAKRAIKALEAP